MNAFAHTLKAEWIKVFSVAFPWWIFGTWAAMSLVCSFLTGQMIIGYPGEADLDSYTVAVTSPGIFFVLLFATMAVTLDYRFDLNVPTRLGTPSALQVAAAKYVVAAPVLAVASVVLLVVAPLPGYFIAHPNSGGPEFSGAYLSSFWRAPLAAALVVAMGQGMAMLLRRTAAVVGISLIAALVIPDLVVFGELGNKIFTYSPFNGLNILVRGSLMPEPKDVAIMAVTLLVWCVALWGGGVWLERRRDA